MSVRLWIEKSDEQFFSPGHAVDIIKRLLLHSGMTIDNAVPKAEGHLPNNTRITVIKTPIVDEDRGIAASIRMLHPQRVDRENLIRTESITDEMLSFLEMCVCYGVSYVVAGRTSSGKTTLLNSLLSSVPDFKRIYTIENGARELSLIKRDVSGRIINNVVHTLSRPSDKKESNITQEDLVVTSLRFDPDIICIGEMRDSEASSAIEASSTDHTVVTTVHGDGGRRAHRRIAFLAQKAEAKNEVGILMEQAALAFPIVVFVHKLANNARKVMEITECVVHDNGELEYRVLYRRQLQRSKLDDACGNLCTASKGQPQEESKQYPSQGAQKLNGFACLLYIDLCGGTRTGSDKLPWRYLLRRDCNVQKTPKQKGRRLY